MAAYTQQGAAVQTGGFGSVAPSVVNPNDAFDMLQKAFKTGLLQSAEINNALNVIPAQQRGQIAAANDAVAGAEMNAQLRPLQIERAKLENKGLSIKIDDPLGNKQATAQYFARELAKFGKESTGDFTKDGELLTKLEKEQQDEKIRNTAMLAELGSIAEQLRKEQVPFDINFDAPLRDQLIAARKAQHDSTQSIRVRKELEGLKKEAHDLGIFDYPPETQPDQLRALIQKRVNEKAAVEAAQKAAKPTESQSKNTAFVAEMESANQVIDGLEAEGFAPSTRGQTAQAVGSSAPALRWLANKATPEKELAWTAAKNKWIEAVLRNRSGAAISQSEYRNADLQYFAQPGDTPGVVANKKALRQAAFAAMRSTLPESLIGKADSASGLTPAGSTAALPEPEAQATPTTARPATEIPAPNVKRGSYQGRPIFYTEDAQGNQTITDAKGNPID